MLALPRIAKLSLAGDHDRLLNDILHNGRPVPLAARIRLSASEAVRPAALGLALRRIAELTYRPVDEAAAIVTALLEEQRPDGSFGSIAATAAAVAGLSAFMDQHRPLRIASDRPDALVVGSAEAGLASALSWFDAMSAGARADGLIGDRLDSALIAWLFQSDPRLTGWRGFGPLLRSIDRAGLHHDRETSALLGAAPATDPSRRASVAA